MEKAGLQVALNVVTGDQFLDECIALDAKFPESMCPVAAKAFFERPLILPLADAKLAAIAARCAPADALCFQHHNAIAAFCKMKRGRKPRIACSYNADIRRYISQQRSRRRSVIRGGGIVGGGICHDGQSSIFSSLRSSA